MPYFTKDIVTAEGIMKKQFYKALGSQDFTTGEIVQTRQFVGEHTQAELVAMRAIALARATPSAEELATRQEQADLQVAEIDSKLAEFQ